MGWCVFNVGNHYVHGLHLFQATSKIVALAKLGRITSARKLFDEIPHKDTVAWNAMLSGYSQLGLHQDVLCLFHRMRIANARPDDFTFTAMLSACADLGELRGGMKIHAEVVVSGCQSSLPVNNSLIHMYGKCLSALSARRVFEDMNCTNEVSWCSLLFAYTSYGLFDAAHGVFDGMPKRTEIAWNIMISGYGQCGDVELCLGFFKKMQSDSHQPDQWTFSSLMNAFSGLKEPLCGYMMHGFIIRSGWVKAVEVSNSIMSFYSKLGSHNDVVKVFESVAIRTQVSWNAMIDANMKIGDTHEALLAFQQAPEKNVVSWTSMITGYARNRHGEQSLSFFVDMMRNHIQPDDFTFGAVLHACSTWATLGHGKMIHGSIMCHGFHAYVYVGNGLVNMYAKCGDIQGSNSAFNDILEKDLVSWNTMLFGFGLHGLATQALELYEEMAVSGLKPDKVTFIGLLMTCSHLGLVEKGRALFESMVSVHGLSHETEHVTCMVDLLGRGGYMAQARELVEEYSRTGQVETGLLEALLGACFAHSEVRMGANLGEYLKVFEPRKEMSYVLLSNLYCLSGQWKEAEMVRKTMSDQGLKKMPGCSWIEVRNKMTVFVAGDHSHPYMEELYKILNFLKFEMRHPCFSDFKN